MNASYKCMTCVNLTPSEEKCYRNSKKIYVQYIQSMFLDMELKRMLVTDDFIAAKLWIKRCSEFVDVNNTY